MHKFNIVILLYIIGIIYLVESDNSKTLNEEEVDAKEADQSLSKIEPNETLPMVLFKYGEKNKLFLPNKLQSVRLVDGKMIQGTQFTYKSPSDQMFFCSDENNASKTCLVHKKFDENEHLKCAHEVTPVLKSEARNCGSDFKSTLYTAVYQICENDEMKFGTKQISFYSICYNKKKQTTLFTVHAIRSPELLNANLLMREREVDYRIMETNEFPVSSSEGPDDMEIDEESTSNDTTRPDHKPEDMVFNLWSEKTSSWEKEDDVQEKSTSQHLATKPGYQWQKFVPSEDMALGSWRKTTFQKTNLALQHENLINLWNKICNYIRFNAIKNYIYDETKTFVLTGVLSLDSAHEDDGDQLANMWIKVVLTVPSIHKDMLGATHGLAILMNNFVSSKKSLTASSYSKIIEDYCDQDLCTDALIKEFNLVKGQVRCCLVNETIMSIFNAHYVEVEELYIPNVNVTGDLEILKDERGENFTDVQAAESIGEILPNEILPIILFTTPHDYILYTPQGIHKIVTKNKRIVNGTEFFLEDPGFDRIIENAKNQIFFCPKEDPVEECLVPRTFGRLEPLQCTVPATPSIKKKRSLLNKCGIDDSGTLHEVVFEICPPKAPSDYYTTELHLYQVCYDENRKIILYTRHKIMSEKLLSSKLLFRERDMKFQMMPDAMLELSNFEELEKASQPGNKTDYKLQKFVPSEDMAFASWIVSTNQYTNVALQHEDLIPLWNDINQRIKDNALVKPDILKNAMYKPSEDFISTGVLYKQYSPLITAKRIDERKPDIWFKVVYIERSKKIHEGVRAILHQQGTVILMNNFIISETDDPTPSENVLKQFCNENICADELLNKFQQIGGQIRCCRLNNRNAKLLGVPTH